MPSPTILFKVLTVRLNVFTALLCAGPSPIQLPVFLFTFRGAADIFRRLPFKIFSAHRTDINLANRNINRIVITINGECHIVTWGCLPGCEINSGIHKPDNDKNANDKPYGQLEEKLDNSSNHNT